MSYSILILTNRVPYPLHDGGALAIDAMIRGYAAAGWNVHLLAMNTSRHPVSEETIAGLYPHISGIHSVVVDNAVRTDGIIKNLLFSREPEHAARFRDGAFGRKLRELLREIKPDAVQLESPFLASYISIIRAESDAALVYRSHNIEGQIWSRLAAASSGLKAIYLNILSRRMARYEQKLWQNADLLLPISEDDASLIKSKGIRTPMVVAPFGIQSPEKDIPLPPGPFKVYHIGAMDWLPNQEGLTWFLKEVWPLVHRWVPEIEFHFAGRAMPESLKQNLPEGVFCAGAVDDARAFIADKHILAVPLRSGSGIRVKTLEAMAAGKLVVSTDIGMQGIVAQPDLHYLGANDAQTFAHLIGWASAHHGKAESITGSAQALVREHYNEDRIMQNVINGLQAIKAL